MSIDFKIIAVDLARLQAEQIVPRSRPSKEQHKVDQWNKNHAIGTLVLRYRLMRPRREPAECHKTSSAAWLLGGHTAVVLLDTYSGVVALDALEVQ